MNLRKKDMGNKILKFLILSLLFYFASLGERKLSGIYMDKNDKLTFKQFFKGYIYFIAISVWLYILFMANQYFLSGD